MAFSSLLDQPAIRMRASRFSVEQYHLLGETGLIPEQVKLLDGIIVEKRSKSPLHSRTVQRLMRALRAALPLDLDVRQEQPITSYDLEPEPDLRTYPHGQTTMAEDIRRLQNWSSRSRFPVRSSTIRSARFKPPSTSKSIGSCFRKAGALRFTPGLPMAII